MRIILISLPTPYPVGPVHVYLLPGPPRTLVDCGPKTPEARAALEAGLAAAGVGLARVERLILTHGHVDHFGLAAAVAAASGCRVYAHQAEIPKLALDRSFVEPMRALLTEAGFPDGTGDRLLGMLRRYRDQLEPVTPTDLVADGDRLPLADGDLTVLHTPGHAQGHICLWDGEALVAGDLLLEEISPNPIVEFGADGRRLRTLPALVRSLERIAALNPPIAYPGHGDPVARPAARAREVIRHHEEREVRLARMLAERPWTLREIAAAWFPGLEEMNLILGLSEVLGHLDLIEARGRLAAERRGGVVYYSLAAA
jgi:glyoxylase-like metal-dependent hydrolase (beta-lactamase superfamily II)